MASRMTEKGYQWGVKALQKRRAEIAGDIAQLRGEVRRRRRDLQRVDDILRILAPGSDPTTIANKRPVKHLNIFRQGQLNGLVLGVLKAAGSPMTNIDVLDALMMKLGAQVSARDALRRRVNANLAYLRDTGRLVKLAIGLWTLHG